MGPNSNTKIWLAILTLLTLMISVSDAELTTIALKADAAVETVWVTVEATARATPTAPMHPSYTDPAILQKEVLEVSNEYRKKHDAKPLIWNDTLTQYAKAWAKACIWKHSHGAFGENLAYGFGNLSAAVIAWGEEGKLYEYDPPMGSTEETGHFTQLVWKASKQVGCAAYNCGYTEPGKKTGDKGELRAQGWYVVCEYSPHGNIVGDDNKYFKENVLPMDTKVASALEASKTAAATATANTAGAQGSHTGGAMRFGMGSTVGVMLVALGTVCVEMVIYF